ncbi:hypothetical protein MRS44_005434 [Fusarium solani]|uniref:uncharacterized protein n=1 Tax=Fusarium solani TaxID=169388 RepID=UPI0032C4269C|nr:hypothetical protein MRS44_005434 [Fusarium solani]
MRDAIDATSDSDPHLPVVLDNLAVMLMDRYRGRGSVRDLDEAIDISRQAVEATPESDPARANCLDNLGVHLGYRHWRGGLRSDIEPAIEEAISVAREAVSLTPENHPRLAGRWKNLGTHLGHKYIWTESNTELKECIQCHLSALNQRQSSALDRITAAREALAYCADVPDWEQAYQASSTAVSLFPKLIFRSLHHSDRLHMLGQVAGMASDAAAMALNAGKDISVALRLLEEGRGVLSRSMEEMRSDLGSLRVQHPHFADELARIRNALDDPLQYERQPDDPRTSWQIKSERRQEADEQLEDLLGRIRKESGFEDYLVLPSAAEMKSAAKHGPIVVINVSQFRCDAIIVEPHKLRLLPLPKLSLRDVEDLYRIRSLDETPVPLRQGSVSKGNFNLWEALLEGNEWEGTMPEPGWNNAQKQPQDALGSQKVLSWLWEAVTEPILNALGLTQTPTDDNWPHVWWIPTGMLSKFPIHAAGKYSSGTSRRSWTELYLPMERTNAILGTLPYATREVSEVRKFCKSMSLNPIEPRPRKKDILPHLRNCTIFHFAGHGKTNSDDPLNNKLLLNDWQSDPLTVGSLLDEKLHDSPPFLAYLSACETGRIDNERFSDENIHLVSGCQLAGFRHVIGTLWEVEHESCVHVARITYKTIEKNGMTDESVSRGLHAAARFLRDEWSKRHIVVSRGGKSAKPKRLGPLAGVGNRALGERGNRDVHSCSDDDDEGAVGLYWVPYVHFGA